MKCQSIKVVLTLEWNLLLTKLLLQKHETTAFKKHEIEVKMNNIVRTITWNKKFTHVSHLYQNLNLLKLNDIYKLELPKFMHKLYNNNLPIVFQNRFAKIEKIHTYATRGANKSNYFLSRINKTVGKIN